MLSKIFGCFSVSKAEEHVSTVPPPPVTPEDAERALNVDPATRCIPRLNSNRPSASASTGPCTDTEHCPKSPLALYHRLPTLHIRRAAYRHQKLSRRPAAGRRRVWQSLPRCHRRWPARCSQGSDTQWPTGGAVGHPCFCNSVDKHALRTGRPRVLRRGMHARTAAAPQSGAAAGRVR